MAPLVYFLAALGIGTAVDYQKDYSGLHLKSKYGPKRTGGKPELPGKPGATAPAAPANGPTPPMTPQFINPANGTPVAPTSPTANQQAHEVQPQPAYPPQPPLPPAPPQDSLPAGYPATVTTSSTGQAGALMCRSQPSTSAPAVPGGDPGAGGGFAHGATVQVNGPMTAGFLPVSGPNMKGQPITGWSYAGYLTGQHVAEATAADAGEAASGTSG